MSVLGLGRPGRGAGHGGPSWQPRPVSSLAWGLVGPPVLATSRQQGTTGHSLEAKLGGQQSRQPSAWPHPHRAIMGPWGQRSAQRLPRESSPVPFWGASSPQGRRSASQWHWVQRADHDPRQPTSEVQTLQLESTAPWGGVGTEQAGPMEGQGRAGAAGRAGRRPAWGPQPPHPGRASPACAQARALSCDQLLRNDGPTLQRLVGLPAGSQLTSITLLIRAQLVSAVWGRECPAPGLGSVRRPEPRSASRGSEEAAGVRAPALQGPCSRFCLCLSAGRTPARSPKPGPAPPPPGCPPRCSLAGGAPSPTSLCAELAPPPDPLLPLSHWTPEGRNGVWPMAALRLAGLNGKEVPRAVTSHPT